MLELLQMVPLAVVMFAATNADDLVLLVVFFARPECRTREVVLGQLAGIGALTAISYTAASLAVAVPHGWLPWVGLVPVFIGVRWLFRRGGDDGVEEAPMRWWSIAGITMANGADNLGVYIPAFAIQSGAQKAVTGVVFLLLTLLLCMIARWTVRHPAWGPAISRVLRAVAPYVLIGIGLWIIAHHPLFAAEWFR